MIYSRIMCMYIVCILYYRSVVEYGTYVKHLKVEVYLFDLKLCVHPQINELKVHSFSRADTIGKRREREKK